MVSTAVKFSALELCNRGEYLAAADSLGIQVGEWPKNVSGGHSEQADALLAAGIILSSLGRIQQVGSPADAEQMILESIRLYGDDPRYRTAQGWLAWVFEWAGEKDKALVLIDVVLSAGKVGPAVRFRTLLLKVIILSQQELPDEAFAVLREMESLYDSQDQLLKGKFHCQRGRALRLQGQIDRAITEYDCAIHFFREVRQPRFEAVATNNLAGLYLDAGRFIQAHDHASRARRLFHELGDKTYEARSWDQSAQIYLAEGRFSAAKGAIDEAFALIKNGDPVWAELFSTSEKIKHASRVKPLRETRHSNGSMRRPPHFALPDVGSERREEMTPLEILAALIHNPDQAAMMFDLIIFVGGARGDPQREAEVDLLEEFAHSKTEHGIASRAKYKNSRLITSVDP